MSHSSERKIINLSDYFTPRPYQLPIFDAFKRGYKRIIAVMPRRCLSGESQIILSNGSFKLLKDIEPGDRILSWNGKSFEEDVVKNVWKTDVKDTVTVRSGKYLPLISSHDHVFAHTSPSNDVVTWSPLKDISERRSLLQYAGCNYGTNNDLLLAEFYGFMLSDGYVCGYQQPKFTNNNTEILNRVDYLAKQLFDVDVIWRKKGKGFDLCFSNKTKGGGSFSNPVKELFRKEQLDIPKKNRKLPSVLWEFTNEALLMFFSGVIAADGNIYCHKNGFTAADSLRNIPASVEITISAGFNDEFAWGLYWLLRKMGIVPQSPYKEKGSNWKIRIAKSCAVKLLLSRTIYGKENQRNRALELTKSYSKKTSIVKGCYRSTYKKVNNAPQQLYDLETVKNHNFIANGYIVHNSGKDLACWNLLIWEAMQKPAIYWYLLPDHKQARRVIFDGKRIDGRDFMACIPDQVIERVNSTEMKIKLLNGSLIQIMGVREMDSLRGANPYGIVFSEYAYVYDSSVFATLLPIIQASNGWVIFISTPRAKNHFHELFNMARNNPSKWFSYYLTVKDTNHIPQQQIEEDIKNGIISWDMAQQEYYCSWDLGISGVVYGTAIDRMRTNNQITDVPWQPEYEVHTSWDIGNDTTAICFFQIVATRVHIIDYYQRASENLEHYVNVLKSKPYSYGKHYFPHDMAVTEWAGPKFTRVEKARQLGIKATIVDSVGLEDGIEVTRSALARIYIDENKCSNLIKCIENYRYEWNDKRQIYSTKPLHNSASHGADSLRYLCISLGKTKDSMTQADVDRLRREALYNESPLPKYFYEGR